MTVNMISVYCNLLRFQPSCLLWKANFNRIQLRNFSLRSYVYSNIIEKNSSELVFSGVENIQVLQSASKKHNKLSKVDEKDIPLVEDLKKGNPYYPYKSPEDKFTKVVVEDGKIALRKVVNYVTRVELGNLEQKYFCRHTDILIIGGGAVGLLIAHALRTQFPHGPEVMVVDKIGSFPPPSLNLSQSLFTQQLFSQEEEISILKYGAEFFSSFSRKTRALEKPEFKLPYDPMGSLILADNKNADRVLKNVELLKSYGIRTKLLNAKSLKEKFPWLNSDDVLFGSLGVCNEGTIDPWTVLYGLKCKAICGGVNFVTGEVIDFGSNKDDVVRVICKLPDGTYNSIDFAYCIIAAGIESLNLVKIFNESHLFNLGLNLPLEEKMRYEYCFYSPDGPGLNTPVVVDSDDTYFRREGLTGHYVAGVPSIVYNDDGENTPYQVFENQIKPFLSKRLPHLNKLELINGWISSYDFCFSNRVGITGSHPETHRIIFALGFSHYGLLLLPALARAVMEYIYYNSYQTIDFTPFHIENLWRKQHLESERGQNELLEAEKRIPLTD